MFDLIFAFAALPIFVAASICFRSWLRFNQAQKMYSGREAEWEEELEVIFSNEAEESCLKENLLKFDFDAN